MRRTLSLSLGLVLAGGLAFGDDPPAKPAVEPKAADADAPLPKGWPGATQPGKIEVKGYPAYRSALAKSKRTGAAGGDMLFWALFNHIKRREIAMTAPVINTYKVPKLIETPDAKGEVTMEFLYRDPEQGKAGPDGATVTVEDHPAATFVCLGIQGGMSESGLRDGAAKLEAWLEAHRDQWVAAGPPRRLGYHGPMTPAARRLWEVQIPIKPAPRAD